MWRVTAGVMVGASVLAACSADNGVVAPPPERAPMLVSLPAPPSAAPLNASVTAAPSASTPAPVASAAEPTYDFQLVVHKGWQPCTLRFTGSTVQLDDPDTVVIMYISKIETLEAGGCTAGTFYRGSPDDDQVPGPIGTTLPKPGHEKARDISDGALRFVDLDHDGYLDFDYLLFENKYSTNRSTAKFEPKARRFELR